MDGLADWDDLIHGTAVFSAAVPFLVSLLLAWKLPLRFWWVAVIAALTGPFLWLFGIPALPPQSSEHVALVALLCAVIVFALASAVTWPWCDAAWWILLAGLSGSVYPAWLAEAGGLSRRLLVCGGVAASAVLLARAAEFACQADRDRWFELSLAVLVPPSVALAVLLQLGGAARFGQAMGAVAAALGALCLLLILRKPAARPPHVAALWGTLFMLFAWSGWLFAEIRYGLAAALLLAPAAGILVNRSPLPRRSAFFRSLWDGLASAIVSATVAGIAIADYLAAASEFEGY